MFGSIPGLHENMKQTQGVLCLHCFLRLWKNNCVSRKQCIAKEWFSTEWTNQSTKINRVIQKTVLLENRVNYLTSPLLHNDLDCTAKTTFKFNSKYICLGNIWKRSPKDEATFDNVYPKIIKNVNVMQSLREINHFTSTEQKLDNSVAPQHHQNEDSLYFFPPHFSDL